MRNVPFSQSSWFFSNDNLQGLRTGTDFCTEHEMGISNILDAFKVDRDAESVERFRIRSLPSGLMATEHQDAFAIMYQPNQDDAFLKRKIEHNHINLKDGDPVIAWDEKGFLLMSPLSNARYTEALKSLWDAFQQHDVYLGGPFGDHYSGGGMGFFIASQMPETVIKAANDEIAEKAEKQRQIEKGAQREKFAKIKAKLSKQGKQWFFLGPHGLFEDGSVRYWLNPWHQQRDYFGAVTIQDLKDWANDTGKIPGGSKRKR